MKMMSRQELEEAGWTRRTVYSGWRLNDIVQSYEEAGFEVTTLPAGECDIACDACMDPDLKVVYTRPTQEAGLEEIF